VSVFFGCYELINFVRLVTDQLSQLVRSQSTRYQFSAGSMRPLHRLLLAVIKEKKP
jgi:hypothetical protein